MSTPPPNPIVQTVDEIIQALLYDVGVNAAVLAIVSAVPFFGLPLIKQIVTYIVQKIAGLIYKFLDQFVDFSIVDFQTQLEADQYLAAVNNLQAAVTTGDQNAIDQARTAFKANLQSLIKFDGF